MILNEIFNAASSGDPIIDLLVRGGAIGTLVVVLLAVLRGDLVTGRELKRVIVERDRAIDLVYAQAQATARALDVAETKKGR